MTHQHFTASLIALLLLFSLGCSAAQPAATPQPAGPATVANPAGDPYPAMEGPTFTPAPTAAYPVPGEEPISAPTPEAYPVPGSDSQEPAAAYDIQGNISDVQAGGEGGKLGRIRVEGEKIEGNTVSRADVTITQDTRIREQKDGQLVDAGFEALEFGERIQVTFTGPIAESDPVQATASEVIILNRTPKN